MSRNKTLNSEQLEQAEGFFEEGWSNRQIASFFGVPKSTIWDNVYANKKRIKIYNSRRKSYLFIAIKSVILIVNDLRKQGLTSSEVAFELQIPLEEVNFIYAHFDPALTYYLRENEKVK